MNGYWWLYKYKLTELVYFKLLYDEFKWYIVEKHKEKYGENFINKILELKAYNTYKYLYVTRGISDEDILAFIGIILLW